MKERAKRVTVPPEVREQIKHEQGCKCLLCHRPFKPQLLYIHHKQPVSHHKKGEGEYANRRENLCALCMGCHQTADHMALEYRIYIPETQMLPGEEYQLPQAAD